MQWDETPAKKRPQCLQCEPETVRTGLEEKRCHDNHRAQRRRTAQQSDAPVACGVRVHGNTCDGGEEGECMSTRTKNGPEKDDGRNHMDRKLMQIGSTKLRAKIHTSSNGMI